MLFVIILLVLVIPAIRQDNITTPLRLNGDSVGYAGAAQSLVDGNTLSSINRDTEVAIGKTKDIQQSNALLLRLDLHCSSIFLLGAMRWGYPIILASTIWAVGYGSVYHLNFILLIFAWAALLGLLYFACKEIMKAHSYICWGLVIALALNCNLLNVYYEGSYAQIMSMPILFMMILYIYSFKKKRITEIIFVSFLLASLMTIWFESYVSLLVIASICIVLTINWPLKEIKTLITTFIFGTISSLIIIAPLTWNWILILKNLLSVYLKDLSIGGWWQPQWATPTEIMGWINIYAHGSMSWLISRNTLEMIVVSAGSVLIIACITYYILKEQKAIKALWLASPIFVILVLIKCHVGQSSNYEYYKAYTEVMPAIFILVYLSIFYIIEKSKLYGKIILYGLVAVTIVASCVNGVLYIRKYEQQSIYYSQEMFKLQKDSVFLNNYVIMTPDIQPYYYKVEQLAGVVRMNWYDYVFEKNNNIHLIDTPYLNMPVAIIIFNGEPKDSGEILYSNKELEIIKSPCTLEQGLDKNGNVDINNYLGEE